ncbi:hypothetical protein ACI2K4_02440 [Micromonospora sp. NPDC050397]|uniref:hypothetical protein n=1 Tax=Micromonospora sp. NPDC050397 TaxID=3364279 RepID=UPI00384F1958
MSGTPDGEPAPTTDPERVPLVKVTVNLTPAANEALVRLAAAQRMSKTDTLNRAVLVSAMLLDLAPGHRFSITPHGGTPIEVYLV